MIYYFTRIKTRVKPFSEIKDIAPVEIRYDEMPEGYNKMPDFSKQTDDSKQILELQNDYMTKMKSMKENWSKEVKVKRDQWLVQAKGNPMVAFISDFGVLTYDAFKESTEIKIYNLGKGEIDSEEKLLNKIKNTFSETRIPPQKIMGHNITNMDLPFFFKRCHLRGVTPPDILEKKGLDWQWDKIFIDLLEHWHLGGMFDSRRPHGLDEIAMHLQLSKRPTEEKEWLKWELETMLKIAQKLNLINL